MLSHQIIDNSRKIQKLRTYIFKYLVLSVFYLGILSSQLLGQSKPLPKTFPYQAGYWEEAMLSLMTLDEKIAQLFMVAVYSSQNNIRSTNVEQVENLIKQYNE